MIEIGPGSLLGHYRLLDRIGAGGMGVVYRARDERLDREVAVKVLPPGSLEDDTARKRFRREALLLSKVNHPNIATIHDFDTESGIDFLVMEYIRGVSLDEKIREGAIAEEEVRHIALQLAEGLKAAHAHGIVHRDLKPGNLRITPDGRVKILDFGLAQLLQPTTSSETSDRAMNLVGTLPYMAPEQILGNAPDARTDVYAAGMILYELAVGRHPFKDLPGGELLTAIVQREPPAPRAVNPGISPSLDRAITSALVKNPAQRLPSADALADALRSSGENLRDDARRGRPGRRLVLSLAIAAFLLVVAVVSFAPRVASRRAVPGGKITVAVLPLYTLSAPESVRFLGVGIPDAIITRLARVSQLVPRPTTAVLRYENQTVDPKEVGRTLTCDYVLTGILLQAADRLRVSVQLVRSSDGALVWGNDYALARSDLLDLQDQIARAVADALQVQMSAAERTRIFQRYTDNAAAYELYLQGRAQLARYTQQSVRAAVDTFDAALRIDPNSAPARAGLGISCAMMRLRFAPDPETAQWGERAEREARAALRADPQLAEAHEALAAVYRAVEFQWEEALEESRLALQLNSNLDQPHFYRAAAFYHLGLLDLVEPEVRAGLDINPTNRTDASRTLGITALYGGRYSDAVTELEEARRLSQGTTFNYFLGLAYYYTGDLTRVDDLLAPLRGNLPSDRRAQAILASVRASARRRNEAIALVREVLASAFMDHHIAYSIGATYAQLGDLDEANRWLRKAADTGLRCYPWYRRDPLLDPLRSDPAFQRLLEEIRQSTERAAARYAAPRTS